MIHPKWQHVTAWFERVVELAPGDRRSALETGCDDPDVRREVLALLAADEESGARFEPSRAYRAALGGGLAGGVAQADAAAGGERAGLELGPYRLLSLLGTGGMGSVWLAERRDAAFEKRVAVKLLKRGLDTDELLTRFRRERQVLASLEHPGIARLLDGGAAPDGRPYMVLEFVDGLPIDSFCREQGLALRERLELFRRTCAPVQFAHEHLVVHRDLKPSNILVEADGAPRLLDFGIAKLLDSDAPQLTGELERGRLLTPDYASPEQVCGGPITTATDVYALGVVLYQLLTGRLPRRFDSRDPRELERTLREEPVPPPSAVAEEPAERRALAGDLDRIVATALHPDVERRYPTVAALSEDLRRHSVGQPVSARPDTFTYRAGKFLRRNPVPVLATAVVVLVLAVALGLVARSARDTELARARSVQRFEDLRELTHTLVFDLSEELENLTGATAARERLIATGLAHLADLAAEAGDDPRLLAELAAGTSRLAEVLGRPTAANLGDTPGALVAYERALALRERQLTLEPESPEARREHALALDGVGTLLLRTGRAEEALAHFDRALAVLDGADATVARYHRSEALGLLGHTAEATTASEENLAAARAAVLGEPEDREARRTLHVTLFRLADQRSLQRDFAAAEAAAGEGLAVAEALLAEVPDDARAERDVALLCGMLARIRMDDGRPGEARELVERQLALATRLAEADPANLLAQRDLSLAHERAASLATHDGRLEVAFAGFERSVLLDESIVAADPANREWQRDLAVTHEKLVGVALELGRVDVAFASTERMLELLEPLAEEDPRDLECRRPLAMAHLRLGQLSLAEDDPERALDAFREARWQFRELAEEDPSHAWTRRLAMVATYFVGWSQGELGRDESRVRQDRIAHLRAAEDTLVASWRLHTELLGLGMLEPGDEEQGFQTQITIESLSALRVGLERQTD